MQLETFILLQNINFSINDKVIFSNLTYAFHQLKTGLIGKNAIGKSTLLKLIVGEVLFQSGSIHCNKNYAYCPQQLFFSPEKTIADALDIGEESRALARILAGSINEKDFILLGDKWDIDEQGINILKAFGLEKIPLTRQLRTLSGGELTRLYLAKCFQPIYDFIILDEPSNNLDSLARSYLFKAIRAWKGGMLIASHDRELLNLLDCMAEISKLGIETYGGNYDDYVRQKSIEKFSKEQALADAEKFLINVKQSVQNSREKHEQRKSKGVQLRRSGKIDKLAANSARGRSEKTQGRMSVMKERMLEDANQQLTKVKEGIEVIENIHVDLPETYVPTKKLVLELDSISFDYEKNENLIKNFSFTLVGPHRIALAGPNGSGKSTLMKIINKDLFPIGGTICHGVTNVRYLDQKTSFLNNKLTILDNFRLLNPEINEQDARFALAQFLFRNQAALRKVELLSGGERIRVALACTLMSKNPPQLLMLDEPTNHLDLNSIASIESAIKNFQGAMIVISHDLYFLKNISVDYIITAPFVKERFNITSLT